MSILKRTLLALGCAWLLAGPARAEIRVVATVPGLASLAKEVGGNAVSVKALSRATQDPHFVDAKPSLALDLNKAHLVVLMGLDLEVGWLPSLLVGARNPHIQPGSPGYLDCSQFVKKLGVPDAPVDRSMGDVHTGGNPHYLYDPRIGADVARGIARRLGELDPGNRAAYEANLAAFVARLDAARAGWEKRMAPYRGTPVVAYHNSWVYLSDWLGLPAVGFLEPKPGIPPNPRHVARLVSQARQRHVGLVLEESHHPDVTAKVVAEKLGAAFVRFPADTDFQGGQTYIQYVDAMIGAIEGGLRARRGTK
jgi:zinc/manganese transport system substrate-binding protein